VIGPIARYVEDLSLVIQIIAGVDHRDAGVIPMPLRRTADVQLRGKRVALYTDAPGIHASAEIAAATQRAAATLSEAGCSVEPARPPRLEEALPLTQTYWKRQRAAGWQDWTPAQPSCLSAHEIEQSLFHWDRFKRSLLQFMQRYDLIVCPVAAEVAPVHAPEVPIETWLYTLPYSLSGQPIAVTRVGQGQADLPIGAQLIARPFEDDVALAAAWAVERASGGYVPPRSAFEDHA